MWRIRQKEKYFQALIHVVKYPTTKQFIILFPAADGTKRTKYNISELLKNLELDRSLFPIKLNDLTLRWSAD